MSESELRKAGIEQLPGSLAEALEEFKRDDVVRSCLGDVATEAFLRAKQSEWDEYRTRVMDWELNTYLEIA
jgi:glutamine synthetase